MTESERRAVRLLLGRTVAFKRSFVDLTGSVAAALMLSQAWYWTCELADERDGWFFKSQEEWETETGLTRYEQEGARKKLSALGLMEERRQGLPARLWFRMDGDALIDQLSRLGKNPNQECGEPPTLVGENPQPYIQRLQPEITNTEPTLPTVAAESAPTRTQEHALIKQPMFVFMGKKPVVNGKTLPPDKAIATEVALVWAQERGFEGDLRRLNMWVEQCILFRRNEGKPGKDWEANIQSWILRNIERAESAPQGSNDGQTRGGGPASASATTRPKYGYNERGEPTNRAAAMEVAAKELAETQRARRRAIFGEDGNNVVPLRQDEWRVVDADPDE